MKHAGMNNGTHEVERPQRKGLGIHPLSLFEDARRDGRSLHVSAPMVRYSKLPFRLLVQEYNVDLTYTPMMLAHEFIRHPVARDSDFSTHDSEGPVIAQFASNESEEFARAALLISPWVNGVDLNCGCPQSWAIKEGIGCSLMSSPDKVASMVKAAKTALGPSKSVSIKIRIHKDINETIAFLRIVQAAGVDYVAVHARTKNQRSSTPPDLEALRVLKSHFPDLPMLANGDVYRLEDVQKITSLTGVQGVMAARGILENPALFSGFERTPEDALRRFMDLAVPSGMRFELILHHVGEMLGRSTTKRERKGLTECRDLIDLTDWLDSRR